MPSPAPPDVAVRAATVDDCPAVAALEHARDGIDEVAARERCARHISDPDVCLLVATVDDEIVAFGRAGRFDRPPDGPADSAPSGWYLFGVIVRDAWRRQGIGSRLTDARLDWIEARATEAWYFTRTRNEASLAMHRRSGFVEVTRSFSFPGWTLDGGGGVLCRVTLPRDETVG